MSKEFAYFCSSCGSPDVTRSPLVGGSAACNTCRWSGKNEELHKVDYETDFSNPDQVIEIFLRELRGVIASCASTPIGALLLKWGFIERQRLREELPVYMQAVTLGVARALLDARRNLEMKKHVPQEPKNDN